MTTNKVGVVIGRFQVDDLHEGHLALLSHVDERHSRLLILLGMRISPSTKKNPLDFQLRQAMIRAIYPDATILPLLDASTDKQWSVNVDTAIKMSFPAHSAIIYGGPESSLSVYSGNNEVKLVDVSVNTAHATERREEIAGNPLSSSDFRAGVIYALGTQYPRTVISVDMAGLWRDSTGKLCVAVGRKSGESQYRLPGGFVSPSDETFTAAARREFREETGLWAEVVSPIADFMSDDWRSADQDDVTHRTILFYSWINEMAHAIKANDDLEEALWQPLIGIQANRGSIVSEHWPLFEALFGILDVNRYNLED